VICESGVQRRKISQCASARSEDEVIDRRNQGFPLFLERLALPCDLRHVRVHAEIEMRRCLFALGHPLADDAAHWSELDRFSDFRRPSWSSGLRARSSYNIFGNNAAARPATFEGCEVDASLFRNSLSCGGREYARATKR